MQTSTMNPSDLGAAASDQIDAHRDDAADGLDSVESTLRNKADQMSQGGDKAAQATHRVADALGSTASYIRDTDVKGMAADVKDLVKRNPGPALLAATVFGFFIARSFSRD